VHLSSFMSGEGARGAGCWGGGTSGNCWPCPGHTAPAFCIHCRYPPTDDAPHCSSPHASPLPSRLSLPAGATDPESRAVAAKLGGGYEWRADDAPTFFPGRHASVYFKGERVGEFGIIHPEVLGAFDIVNPGGCGTRGVGGGLGFAGRAGEV
jgi:hypothetical protein